MLNRAAAVAAAVALAGCATLFAGKAQVPVATNPPGAGVYINGQLAGQTPMMLELDPKRPAHVQIYMPGFQPVEMWRHKGFSGWFWVNLLFWPGLFVDLATGAYERYEDNAIMVGLVPEQAPPPEWSQPAPGPGTPQPVPPPSPAPVQPGQLPVPQPPPPAR